MGEELDEDTQSIRDFAERHVGAGLGVLAGRKKRRQRSAIEQWVWEPVMIIRLLLIAMYLVSIDFAIWALIAGVPVFEVIAQPDGPFGWFSRAWAGVLLVVSIAGFASSLSDRFERFERWSALAIFSLNATYAIALHLQGFTSNDIARQAAAAFSLYGLPLAFGRFLWLASHVGRRVVHFDPTGKPIDGGND